MGRMKIGIAATSAVLVLLGVVAMATMRSDSGPDHATHLASQTPATTVVSGASYVSPTVPPITVAPVKVPTPQAASSTTPANAKPASTVPQPTAQDIQKLVAGITAQLQAPVPTATGGTAPLTKEQIEAQVKAQLAQLGITY
jgi:hypothetical protein